MNDSHDVVVIGAGPAGLAAATTCAKLGLDIVLLDEQPAPGGQIYRGIESIPAQRARLLGQDYRDGAALLQAFRDSGGGDLCHEAGLRRRPAGGADRLRARPARRPGRGWLRR